MTFAYRFIWTCNDSTSTASKISNHYMFDLKTLHARPSFVWANLCKCSNIDTNMIVSVWWRSTYCFSNAWRPSRLLYDLWSISHLHERPSPTPSVHRAVKAWGYANRRLRNARCSHSESKWTNDRFSNSAHENLFKLPQERSSIRRFQSEVRNNTPGDLYNWRSWTRRNSLSHYYWSACCWVLWTCSAFFLKPLARAAELCDAVPKGACFAKN